MGCTVEESENQTVPSVAIAALLQNPIGVPSTSVVSTSTDPPRGSTVSRPRCASHTSSRPSGIRSIPRGRPPVSATRSTLRPS